jgi:hypothetical protein
MIPRAPPVITPPPVLRQTGNPSPTCFQVKQVARSRRVSCAALHPSILWRNRQTITHLVLKPKPRNRHDNFVGQITKLQLPVLRTKLGNTSTLVLRLNQKTHAPRFHVHGADRTWHHPTSRSSSHRVPNLCLTIPCPLHQVS